MARRKHQSTDPAAETPEETIKRLTEAAASRQQNPYQRPGGPSKDVWGTNYSYRGPGEAQLSEPLAREYAPRRLGLVVTALIVGLAALVLALISPALGIVAGLFAVIFGIITLVLRRQLIWLPIIGTVLGVVALPISFATFGRLVSESNTSEADYSSMHSSRVHKLHDLKLVAHAPGPATADYSDHYGREQVTFNRDWEIETKTTIEDQQVDLTVDSTAGSADEGLVTCEIYLDGKLIAKKSHSGSITCLASPDQFVE